jgi:hypothetical protein
MDSNDGARPVEIPREIEVPHTFAQWGDNITLDSTEEHEENDSKTLFSLQV